MIGQTHVASILNGLNTDEAIEGLSANERSKNLTLRNHVQSLQIVVDKQRMLQVLTNLLSNAIKYSPSAAAIIVSSSVHDGSAEISVTDEGVGIAHVWQGELFERFYQVETGKAGEGYGLGLAICKLVISKHGGDIGVVSEPGKGSRFWFRLPLIGISNR
jgi:two-component system sensor histidine kinase VicK